jgi:hypothetical protein
MWNFVFHMRASHLLNRIKWPCTATAGFYEAHAMSNQTQQTIAPFIDFLDENSAAALLDVSPGTLSVWRSTGRYGIPFLKIGRNVRYRRSDLLAWLTSRLRETGSTA